MSTFSFTRGLLSVALAAGLSLSGGLASAAETIRPAWPGR